jgi:hypothetical protein
MKIYNEMCIEKKNVPLNFMEALLADVMCLLL